MKFVKFTALIVLEIIYATKRIYVKILMNIISYVDSDTHQMLYVLLRKSTH